MDNQIVDIQEFRTRIKAIRQTFPQHWETSRKLMAPESLSVTLPALIQSIQEAPLVPSLQKRLINALQQVGSKTTTKEVHQNLKDLTGLPPSKAVRALIVWGILAVNEPQADRDDLSTEELERHLRERLNPYDILLHSPSPSLLDIGAGDLTFERELVDQYIPQLRAKNTLFRLHAFDRLAPGSRVGGIYHKNPDYEGYLKSFPVEELNYQFWGGMDVERFGSAKGALPRYTMCTCHAPANPTFAYEPSRVDSSLILDHLQKTRGQFHPARYEGEPVLEVSHQGKILTFPPWKFHILGPLALLQLMGERSRVVVLSAIDDEVFWEILSQILADNQFRPPNRIFSKKNIPVIFGDVYQALSALSIGARVDLSTIAKLRDPMPFRATHQKEFSTFSNFRYVEIRRGAFLENIPSSFTARQFSLMKEESTPWWIVFIPNV
ncbi:MAG: hypothetical protein OEY91_00040 [Nitrospirota bacterium]|nr:hypothetical protein [Nitrospirota bacterium]